MAARGVPTRSSRHRPSLHKHLHTYTQRAHNTDSPACLSVAVGRHPGLSLLVMQDTTLP